MNELPTPPRRESVALIRFFRFWENHHFLWLWSEALILNCPAPANSSSLPFPVFWPSYLSLQQMILGFLFLGDSCLCLVDCKQHGGIIESLSYIQRKALRWTRCLTEEFGEALLFLSLLVPGVLHWQTGWTAVISPFPPQDRWSASPQECPWPASWPVFVWKLGGWYSALATLVIVSGYVAGYCLVVQLTNW